MKKRQDKQNFSNGLSYALLFLFIFILGGATVYAVAGVSHDSSELTGVCLSTGVDCDYVTKLQVYGSRFEIDCTAGGEGLLIFDSGEGRPFVCNGIYGWKPLDSDFDEDGIMDTDDVDDYDATIKANNLIANNIMYSKHVLGVVGNLVCPVAPGDTGGGGNRILGTLCTNTADCIPELECVCIPELECVCSRDLIPQ